MAIEKRMMPIPPNHWMKLRQKRTLLGRFSTSGNTVAPVVVKPETVSKYASVNVEKVPVRRKGREPNNATTTHPSVTTRKASLRVNSLSSLGKSTTHRRPGTRATAIDHRKAVC
jgi:hypothetical protein